MDEIRKQAHKTQDEARETRLQFLETELDAALTFARVAATSYSMGHDEHGAIAAAKARDALDEVTDRLDEILQQSPRREYSITKLVQLREAIANLPNAAI